MIKLHKINDDEIYINPELIESIERSGDTVITLVTGNKILVKEEPEVIRELVIEYKKKIAGI